MSTSVEPTKISENNETKDVENPVTLENPEPQVNPEAQENSENQDGTENSPEDVKYENEEDIDWESYSPVTSQDRPRGIKETYAAFTLNYFRLKSIAPANALNHVIGTIYNELKGQRWLAEVSQKFELQLGNDPSQTANCEVAWIVQVMELTPTYDGKILASCRFITLANAMIDDIPEEDEDYVQTLIPSIVEDIQSQEDFDLGQLSPIVTPSQCSEDELTQTIHEVIDLKIYFYKYFLTVIHRNYDLEDPENVSFETRLNNRLQIFEQECNEKIPYSNLLRYEKLQNQYNKIQSRIDEYDAYLYEIQEYEETTPPNSHDPELLEEKYQIYNDKQVLETERDILVENLLYLESTILTCNGPKRPRKSRIPNGRRGKAVSHVLSTNGCISASFMQSVNVEPSTEFQTHVDMQEAVDNLFEGETLFIRASKTAMPIIGSLHDLNESNVVIQGCDESEVVIGQIPDKDTFITTSGVDVVLRNLTFMSSPDNTDGILRVEKGHTVVENCVFNCHNRLGIIVCPEATLTIIDSQINDCPRTAAIIQEAGARVKTRNVGVDRCLSLIEVQTYPKVELPEIVDCKFDNDTFGSGVIIRQLGGTAGEPEPIVIREQEVQVEEEKAAAGEDKSKEQDGGDTASESKRKDMQGGGEIMQSKPEVKDDKVEDGKYVFTVDEAKEWLQSANVNVKDDARLTNIGRLLVIWLYFQIFESIYIFL